MGSSRDPASSQQISSHGSHGIHCGIVRLLGKRSVQAMTDGTAEDWRLSRRQLEFSSQPSREDSPHCGPRRRLRRLRRRRLTHSADRHPRPRADRDDEYVLCALIHASGTRSLVQPRRHRRRHPQAFVSEQNQDGRQARGVPGLLLLPSPRGSNASTREVPATSGSTTPPSSPGVRPAVLRRVLRHAAAGHFEPLVRELLRRPSAALLAESN